MKEEIFSILKGQVDAVSGSLGHCFPYSILSAGYFYRQGYSNIKVFMGTFYLVWKDNKKMNKDLDDLNFYWHYWTEGLIGNQWFTTDYASWYDSPYFSKGQYEEQINDRPLPTKECVEYVKEWGLFGRIVFQFPQELHKILKGELGYDIGIFMNFMI